MLKAGDTLDGRFTLQRAVGKGGMGAVFLAHDELTGQAVAVKVLRNREGDARRFDREARVLAELDHPAIVRYVAHGATADDVPWLAMEWLPGVDLAARLEAAPLAPRDAVALCARVARALAAAHARGVVHRDVKPANLLLPDGDPARVKVLDFGIARRTHGATRAPTGTGVLVGTPGYMAPEQARGDRAIDGRADLYSLGCVLFECLVGRPAFQADHLMALLARILLEEPPRVRSLRPELPEALDALVASLLAKDPARRPRDADAVAEALDACARLCADEALPAVMTPPRPALSDGERRVVCVVLASVPDGPAYAPAETPSLGDAPTETLDGDMGFLQRLDELRARYLGAHGRLERTVDGAVVFASQGATTDEASRAARLALALRTPMPGATIVVAAGHADTGATGSLGAVLERAVALAQTSPGADVLADPVASTLLEDRFRLRPLARGAALLGERDDADEARPLLGAKTPFVGRERELALLSATCAEAAADEVARALVVTAPAGGGKSRLRREFLRALGDGDEAPAVWGARCDQLAADSPLASLAATIRRAAEVPVGAAPARQREALLAFARQLVPADARRVATFLGELTGVPCDDADDVLRAARGDPSAMAEHTRRALLDALAGACQRRPLVLVLDDAHWSDAASLSLLDHALRALRDRPFVVAAFARPELLQRFPRLWADHTVQELRLTPLSRRASERLARRVLGDAAPDAVVARLVARADGNAFYLEELLRAVAAGATDLPDTVLAGVQARLAALPPDTRRLLRAASVFGESCWAGGVDALLAGRERPTHTREALEELCAREVLARASSSRLPGEVEYRFHHALVREAAYAMLTPDDRALGHRLAADWLARAGESDPVVLANHREAAGQPDEAARHLHDAAEAALAVYDAVAAQPHVDRALASITPAADPDLRGALLRQRAEVCFLLARYEESKRFGLEALRYVSPASSDWSGAAASAIISAARTSDTRTLHEMVGRVRELATATTTLHPRNDRARATMALELYLSGEVALGDAVTATLTHTIEWHLAHDPLTACFLHNARATRAYGTENLFEHFVETTAGLAIALRCDNRVLASHCYATASNSLAMLGQPERAERLIADGLALCDAIGAEPQRARALYARAEHRLNQGRFDEAADDARACLRLLVRYGERRRESHALHWLTRALVCAGRDGEARALLDEARAAGELPPHLRLVAAELLLRDGAHRAARDEARAVAPSMRGISSVYRCYAWRVAHDAARALGDDDDARDALAHALAEVRRVEAQAPDDEARAMLVANVRDYAAVLARAAAAGLR